MRISKVLLLATAAAISAQPAQARQAQAQPAEAAPSQNAASAPRLDAGVEISAGYSDNIFATRNREEDDLLLQLRPFARLDLGSPQNGVTLRGEGEVGRYADFGSEDYDDWLIGADGRARLNSSLSLIAGGEWRWDHEDRTSPDAVAGLEPTDYQRGFGYAGLIASGGNFRGRLGATVTRYDFDDVAATGGIINNDDRDRTQVELGARAGVRLRSGTELFVQGSYDRRDYDDPLDDAGFRRDSRGGSIVAGFRRDFGSGFSGEFFGGWLHQDYADPRLRDIDTFDVGAVLDWRGPRGLGGALRLDRSIEETTLAGSAAYIVTSGSLSLRASPHPRLAAGLALSGSQYDYRGAPRSEFIIGVNLWTRFWLNSRLYVGTDYTHSQRSSNAAGFDFDQNRFLLSIGARLRPQFTNNVPALLLREQAPGGLYLGLLAGHGTLVTGLDGPRGPGENTADFGDHGPAAIAVLGYGILIDPLYLGIEAEASLRGPDWLHTADRVFSLDKREAFGAAARIGLVTAHGDLIFGRFGLSSAAFRTDYTHANNVYSGERRRTGLGVGGGIEARAGRRGFVRAEYVVTSYADEDIPTGGGNFDNFSSTESQFRIGGGVRFGAPAPRTGPASPPVRFGGPYIGVQIGHGALVTDNQGTRSGGTQVDISRASHGGVLGAFAGIGQVLGRVYAGAEIEGDISAINWNIERDPNGRVYSAEHDYSYGIAGRAGVLIGDSALVYGRLGAVRTRFDVPYSTTGVSIRSRETRTGVRFGGGLEIALSSRIRLRADYSLTEYRAYDVVYGNNADRFDHSETLFRLGLSWRL